MTMIRNLLPQQLGYSPGTSLIGNFGSTQPRFQSMQASTDHESPGPGHYNLSRSMKQPSPPRWDGLAGRQDDLFLGPDTPGPGAHALYAESGLLNDARRRWPGRPSASGFSANAVRPCLSLTKSKDVVGPGSYEVAASSLFTSQSRHSLSPRTAEARMQTGNRIARSMDNSLNAVFATKSAAHIICAHPIAAKTGIEADPKQPGPGQYDPYPPQRRAPAYGRQLGSGCGFETSVTRFSRAIGEPEPLPHDPGPGAYHTRRWDGRISSKRRPVAALRDEVAFGTRYSPPTCSKVTDSEIGQAVVDYLARGAYGPPGCAIRQHTDRRVHVRMRTA